MDPTSREDLSALMDGELAAEPTRFLLRRLEHDPDLSATWSRWHLIRACLAADPARMSAPKADSDFAARVASALVAERAPPVRRRHWAQYVGGGALAAGVAVAALMLNVPNPGVEPATPVAQAPVAPDQAVPTSLAQVAPAMPAPSPLAPSWLLSRQPTVLGAQPASANVVYGTGLMQPDYLRRATYARDAGLPFAPSLQALQPGSPFSIVQLPGEPSPASSSAGH